MYFLSMKIDDKNNGIPLMSETNNDIAVLVGASETMTELLTRRPAWDCGVIDNHFNTKAMSDAAMDIVNGKSTDFDWTFTDKYGRNIRCYITSNI